ncbi:MAG: carbamoyl phosphate synthase, partial [Acidimicrobiales bacterium]|nr:carbamoyl phosphate synthase [Acidimicrobiales bacterium]
YTNAGTVEFLYEDGGFYYLEMNTRLQVEHPATELITGIDLVEQQLRIASGEQLPFTQDGIEIRGHAIEIRINAEDPAGGAFLPSPGPITALTPPDGFGIRWDTGYEAGDEISQFYDNLVGKLIVWGRDRDVAINRALRAIGEMKVEGIATTIPADIAILEHVDFRANEHSTKWVEEVLDLSAVSATPAAASTDNEPKIKREVDVEVNGKRFSVAMWVPESGAAMPAGGSARRRSGGAAGSGASGSGDVTVPMQGTIVKVNVSAGDTVEVGDAIVVLEAMKMENNVTAEKAGTVTEIRVTEGDSVGGGDVVAIIE